MSLSFDKLETPGGIGKFNGSLATKSYLQGYTPSRLDAHWYAEVAKHYPQGPEAKFIHARRWFNHIASYNDQERSSWSDAAPEHAAAGSSSSSSSKTASAPKVEEHKPAAAATPAATPTPAAAKPEDDMDDLFGESTEPEVEKKVVEEKRPPPPKKRTVEKSNVIFDVKPTERETDMALMEEKVRKIEMDGLFWGPSKLVEVAYGVRKLQITCVVEDEKVMMDDLEEKIMAFEDLVQSVDIASMVRAG